MRRIAAACALATIAGCASTGKVAELGGTTSPSTVSAVQAGGGANGAAAIGLNNTTTSTKATVELPIDRAWSALDKSFTVMGISPTERDEKTHTLANASFRVRRKLGDVPLIRALDCGGESSAPNAETYEIMLSVRSRLTAQPSGGTEVETIVEGVGRNPLTNNTNQVPCYSTGGIEKRLVELVKQAGLEKPSITVAPKKPPVR